MVGSSHRARPRPWLGVLIIAASVLWTLVFAVAALTYLPHEGDLVLGLFAGSAIAAGIVALCLGIFLGSGWVPGRRGWLVLAAVALCPLVLTVGKGVEASRHLSAVNDASELVYTKWTGVGDPGAQCAWEYNTDRGERWTCEVEAASARESCVVDISAEEASDVRAVIFECESDAAGVNAVVARAYVTRSGRAEASADCGRRASSPNNPDGSEPWYCDIDSGRDQCVATITRGNRRHVTAKFARCDRDVAAAVNRVVARAYARRAGHSGITTTCVSNLVDPAEWECAFHPGEDECSVNIMRRGAGRITAHIRFCSSGID